MRGTLLARDLTSAVGAGFTICYTAKSRRRGGSGRADTRHDMTSRISGPRSSFTAESYVCLCLSESTATIHLTSAVTNLVWTKLGRESIDACMHPSIVIIDAEEPPVSPCFRQTTRQLGAFNSVYSLRRGEHPIRPLGMVSKLSFGLVVSRAEELRQQPPPICVPIATNSARS
ncbi:hypothetical protein LZ31DRAFT_117438 [Colletotrichum somersetense]|nr:hypothetical protein LZ31DRAFT_117438 [Colletotrichum somersetense]